MHAEQPFKWIQSYLCKNWHIRLVIIFKKFSSEASWLQQPSSSYLRWWILSVTVIFYSILPIRNWKSLFRRRAGDELCSQSSAHAEDFICLMGARFFVNPTIFTCCGPFMGVSQMRYCCSLFAWNQNCIFNPTFEK